MIFAQETVWLLIRRSQAGLHLVIGECVYNAHGVMAMGNMTNSSQCVLRSRWMNHDLRERCLDSWKNMPETDHEKLVREWV